MAWFKDHLYVGTGRATLCFARQFLTLGQVSISNNIEVWPVEFPHAIYSPEFEHTQARAEIWRYSPLSNHWERVYQAPIIISTEGGEISRDFGYRAMVVFQGKSDPEPALYVATCARRLGPGPVILRSENGKDFLPVSKPGLVGDPITSLRSLVPFKGRLFTAGDIQRKITKGHRSKAGIPAIYESSDPVQGEWRVVNEPGFGDPDNNTVYEFASFGDYLYVGTENNNGFQIWRTSAEGEPPYQWTKIISDGAGRNSLNQATVSMVVFKDALYIGTGIQNGGYDRANNIGPAGAEIIRINHDGSWELIMGDARDGKYPLSGLSSGFNTLLNGYLWRMSVHEGWLYAGTMGWGVFLRYSNLKDKPSRGVQIINQIGLENIVENQGGFDLWRSSDGENWLPVTRQGFGNPFNYGVRNIVSTPHGLFVGTANPFGPRVAVQKNEEWVYVDNPDGGLEIWQGN
jgi:hypothetical protein